MNYHLFQALNDRAGRADGIDDVMEFAANWLIYAVFAVVALLAGHALLRGRRTPVLELGATLFLAFAMGTVLGHLSHQVRPFQSHPVHQLIAHEPGVSLPSDHATAAFAMAFAVAAFLHRGWGIALTAGAVAIGVARVWVGVHYPGDIAAAAVIAGLAVAVVLIVRRRRVGRWSVA